MESSYEFLGAPFLGNVCYYIRGRPVQKENINILEQGVDLVEAIGILIKEKNRKVSKSI